MPAAETTRRRSDRHSIVPHPSELVRRSAASSRIAYVGREFGSDVEILDGAVNENDRLVANPPMGLTDGMIVDARPFVPPAIPALLPPKPSAPRV